MKTKAISKAQAVFIGVFAAVVSTLLMWLVLNFVVGEAAAAPFGKMFAYLPFLVGVALGLQIYYVFLSKLIAPSERLKDDCK